MVTGPFSLPADGMHWTHCRHRVKAGSQAVDQTPGVSMKHMWGTQGSSEALMCNKPDNLHLVFGACTTVIPFYR